MLDEPRSSILPIYSPAACETRFGTLSLNQAAHCLIRRLKTRLSSRFGVRSVAQGEFLSGGEEVAAGDTAVSRLHRDILFEDEKIGDVSIIFDNSVHLQEAKALWAEILTALLVQIAISVAVVYLLLRVFANMQRNRVMLEVHDTLRESERKYRSLFENATAGIGRSELHDGKVLLANRKLTEIFGYDNAEAFISDFNFSEHCPEKDGRKRLLERCERHPDEPVEATFTDRNGALVFVEAEVAP